MNVTKFFTRNLPLLNTFKQLPLTSNIRYFTDARKPINFGIVFVPEKHAYVVQRFGKFHTILEPGFRLLIPIVDEIAYVQSLKEIPIDIPDQPAVTMDNVVLQLNGILFLRVRDPYLASYGVEDAEFALSQLAQTTMRSELGKITLDQVFKEREALNEKIVISMNNAAAPWGIDCLRYEIRDVTLPDKIQLAMQLQVEAERKKRATILESEGEREAHINRAEGLKRSKVLQSEAMKLEQINEAEGKAEAIFKVAQYKAKAIQEVATAIGKQNGDSAVQFTVAEQYIQAFGNIAKETNTVLLPSQTGDVSSMVAQAMAIYKTVNTTASVADPSHQLPKPSSTSPPTSKS